MSRSEYYLTLTGDVKCRYDDKIAIIDNIDPYTLENLSTDLPILPCVSIIDMVNYLVLTHSFYTGQQLKAYKSLQAFKFYESGFVLAVGARKINSNAFVIMGKVKHSGEDSSMREKPLEVWLILLADGAVSSAHCTCMDGLGEVCSHVAAILFYLEARPTSSASSSSQLSCTESLARWPVPPTKGAEMLRIRDMDCAREGRQVAPSPAALPAPLGDEELQELIQGMINVGITPAIARVYEPFASQMMEPPRVLPNTLEALFTDDFMTEKS